VDVLVEGDALHAVVMPEADAHVDAALVYADYGGVVAGGLAGGEQLLEVGAEGLV
jgi:hypothetical protein